MKNIFKSKTVWLNVIMGVVAAATYIDPSLLEALGFAPESQDKVLKIVGTITAILNIVLRFATTKAITTKRIKKGNPDL